MTVNPYKDDVAALMATRSGCISDETRKSLTRRYERMGRDLALLKEQGMIKTFAPSKIGDDDVKTFIIYRKGKNHRASDVSHDISALNQLCLFRGNAAVEQCLQKNIGLRPKDNQTRLEPLSDMAYRTILDRYNSLGDGQSILSEMRPFAMVLLYIGTGARNKEIRLAKRTDIDTEKWVIHFEHVKGEGKYGEPRNVPIPEELIPVVQNYLMVSEVWLMCHGKTVSSVEPLFFKMGGDFGYLSGNGIRSIKSHVEKEVDLRFKLQDCRRAFGQHYMDNDASLEDVSFLMGHCTTRTTEMYYCRKRESEVFKNVKGKW